MREAHRSQALSVCSSEVAVQQDHTGDTGHSDNDVEWGKWQRFLEREEPCSTFVFDGETIANAANCAAPEDSAEDQHFGTSKRASNMRPTTFLSTPSLKTAGSSWDSRMRAEIIG
jgi:hypothetical protein